MPSYLWQNFLKDSTYTIFIAQQVAKLCEAHNISCCIEIGPGKGALTKKLIATLQLPLILLEKDEKLLPHLQPHLNDSVTLIMGDALTSEPASLLEQIHQNPTQTIIVGNLPYYITSPLLTHFFWWWDAIFPAGVFMVQKEVADKIRSDALKKSFLRWLLNYQYDVKYLKTVPAKAFSPAPKVQSAIFSLVAKSQTPSFPYVSMVTLLERISMYKRKTLGKIRKMAGDDIAHALPEDLAVKRLEEIGWEEMQRIMIN